VPASLFTDLPRSSGSSIASRQLCNELCDPSEAPVKKSRTTGPVPTNIHGLQACNVEIYDGVADELDTDYSQCDTKRAAYEDGKAAVPNNLSLVADGAEGEVEKMQIRLSEAATSDLAENDFLRCDEVRCLFFPFMCACERAQLREQGNSLLEERHTFSAFFGQPPPHPPPPAYFLASAGNAQAPQLDGGGIP